MKCDTIAEGIFKAAELVDLKLPLVCRLTGTNADKANKMIEEYAKKNPKLKITAAIDLDDAAVKSVAKAKGQWLCEFKLYKYIYLKLINY